MSRRKKKVGGTTETVLILAGLGAAGLLWYFATRPQPVTTVIKTVPSTGSGTTAAEIAAGAGLATTLLNDLTDNGS